LILPGDRNRPPSDLRHHIIVTSREVCAKFLDFKAVDQVFNARAQIAQLKGDEEIRGSQKLNLLIPLIPLLTPSPAKILEIALKFDA